MFSKRELEGYVKIDHSDSPGLTPEQARAAGRSGLAGVIGAGQVFEAPTITCSHCQRVVILNPGRGRTRGYCPKCDHYLCDWCEAARVRTGICKPFSQVIEENIKATIARQVANG